MNVRKGPVAGGLAAVLIVGVIGAVGLAATIAAASPSKRTPTRVPAAAGGVRSSSVITSLPTATITATVTATTMPTSSTTPTITATATHTPTSTAPPTVPATPTSPPIYLPITYRAVSNATADRVAARLMAMLDRPGERERLIVWDWESGVALVALMTAYGDGRDPRVTEWVDGWLARAVRERWVDVRDPALTLPNHVAPVWAALLRDAHVGDGRHDALFDATRVWLMGAARPAGATNAAGAARVALPNGALGLPEAWPGAWAHLPDRPEVWDDTLFMAAPFLARYGRRRGDAALVDEAALQVLAHARILADPATGVWRHGWSRASGDHMSGGRWARGNAWAALAATEIIDSLPPGSPLRDEVRLVLERQLTGLVRAQSPTGLWTTEVTQPGFYTETSGSAGIVAALDRALAAGWLSPPVREAARAASASGFDAVVRRIAPDGTVTGVSMGTGVPSTAQGIALYNLIDTSRIQPYGQGLVLLMFAAREQLAYAEATARSVRAGSERSP